jgi:hypothetical protein
MEITFINSARSRLLSPTGNIHDDIDRVKLCLERKDRIDLTYGANTIGSYLPDLENSIRKSIIAKHIVTMYKHKKYMVTIENLMLDLGI